MTERDVKLKLSIPTHRGSRVSSGTLRRTLSGGEGEARSSTLSFGDVFLCEQRTDFDCAAVRGWIVLHWKQNPCGWPLARPARRCTSAPVWRGAEPRSGLTAADVFCVSSSAAIRENPRRGDHFQRARIQGGETLNDGETVRYGGTTPLANAASCLRLPGLRLRDLRDERGRGAGQGEAARNAGGGPEDRGNSWAVSS